MTAKKKMSFIGLIALFLINFAYMSDLVVIPTADILYGYYLEQGIDMSVLDFILSGSQIFAIIAALFSPLLMRHFSKKTLIVVLYTVFALVTIGTVFYVDPYYIAFSRAVSGLCFGALFPTGIAFIVEIYRNEEDKVDRYIGFYNGTMAFIGGVMSIVSGILLGIGLVNGPVEGLRFSFFEYFISIPILIALIVALPRTPAEKHVEFEDMPQGQAGGKEGFPVVKTVALIISVATANVIYCVIAYQYAIYLPQNFALEPSVVAFIGSIEAFAGGIAGFLFGKMFKVTKRFAITVCFGLMCIAYLLFGFASSNIVTVILGLILNGFAFGFSLAYYYSYSAAVFQPRFTSTITGLLTVGMGLGIFLNTFLTTFFTDLLGFVSFDPVTEMPVTDYVSFMPYVAVVAAVAFVLSLILGIKDKRAGVEIYPQEQHNKGDSE